MPSAKQLTTFLFAFLLTALLVISMMPSTAGQTWSDTTLISTESTDFSRNPSIAIGTDNILHVVWFDGTDYDGSGSDWDVFYKSYNGTWSNTVVISTEGTAQSDDPSIAVGPDNTVHVVWRDRANILGSGSDSDIFYKSYNGTWSDTVVVSTESTGTSSVPSIAVGPDNTVHVVWQDNTDYDGSGPDSDIFYKSYNGTWSDTVVVSTESTGHSYLSSIAAGPDNTVHVVWRDLTDLYGSGSDSDIFYKSFNGTWSDTVVVSTESTEHSYLSSIAVGPDNTAHVFWNDHTDYDGSGTDYDIFYRSFNGTWSNTVVVSTESTGRSGKSSTVVGMDNTVHLAWMDRTDLDGSGIDEQIFYKSFNGTWSDVVVVSNHSTDNSWSPSIAVGADNTIYVVWDDHTDYDGSGTDRDIFYKIKPSLPTAVTGADQPVDEGTTTTFNGSASTAYRGAANYTWTFTYDGSEVVLYGVTPAFQFDIPGDYIVTLTVADVVGNQDVDTMTVTVSSTSSISEGVVYVGVFVLFIGAVFAISMMVMRRG